MMLAAHSAWRGTSIPPRPGAIIRDVEDLPHHTQSPWEIPSLER